MTEKQAFEHAKKTILEQRPDADDFYLDEADFEDRNFKKTPINHILNNYILDNVMLVSVVALSGAFGSIFSILTRLREYKDKDSYTGSAIPILIGFAKPLIGTAFGILILTLINVQHHILSSPYL